MDFEELKKEAKEKLEKALEKQKHIVELLQTDFDNLDKLKKGSVISSRDNYIIVGDPIIEGIDVIVPVRHHVYPQIDTKHISMNFSGVIDYLKIPIEKLPDIKCRTLKEYFFDNKEEIRKKLTDSNDNSTNSIKRFKRLIEQNEEQIKSFKRNIEQLENSQKDFESFSFDDNFESFVDKYIDSDDIKNYIFSVKESDYKGRGSQLFSITIN